MNIQFKEIPPIPSVLRVRCISQTLTHRTLSFIAEYILITFLSLIHELLSVLISTYMDIFINFLLILTKLCFQRRCYAHNTFFEICYKLLYDQICGQFS